MFLGCQGLPDADAIAPRLGFDPLGVDEGAILRFGPTSVLAKHGLLYLILKLQVQWIQLLVLALVVYK